MRSRIRALRSAVLIVLLSVTAASVSAQEFAFGPRMYFATLMQSDVLETDPSVDATTRVEETRSMLAPLGAVSAFMSLSVASVEIGYVTSLGTPEQEYERNVYVDGEQDDDLSIDSDTDRATDIRYLLLGGELRLPLGQVFSFIAAGKYLVPIAYGDEFSEVTIDDLSESAKEELEELIVEAGIRLTFTQRYGGGSVFFTLTGAYNLRSEEQVYIATAEATDFEYQSLDWGIFAGFGFEL